MKEKVIEFLKKLIGHFIILIAVVFIASRLGWVNGSVLEISIAIVIGWSIGELFIMIINKNINKNMK